MSTEQIVVEPADVGGLLAAQRELFSVQVENLAEAADQAEGFERVLLLWRLESTTAVIRFTDTLLAERSTVGR